jgi:hypothetical protein
VALGLKLSLSRTMSCVYLSSPASQQVQSLRGVNYFLHLKGGCVGVGSKLLHPRNADFSKVLQNFRLWCLGSGLCSFCEDLLVLILVSCLFEEFSQVENIIHTWDHICVRCCEIAIYC